MQIIILFILLLNNVAYAQQGTSNCLEYEFFTGSFNSLNDFQNASPNSTGFDNGTFDIATEGLVDGFGYHWEGVIEIPDNNTYTFFTASDDGSRLFIDDIMVVDNDGLHGLRERAGNIFLIQGKHSIRVEFFERSGLEQLIVSWSSPSISKQIIPSSSLSCDEAPEIENNLEFNQSCLDYQFFDGSFDSIDDFTNLEPSTIGRDDGSLDITSEGQVDTFAYRWVGLINIPTSDNYTFFTASDDGSRLFIGDKLVVDNDFLQPVTERSGSINLTAGLHRITVEYFERTGGEGLSVSWQSSTIVKQIISRFNYFCAPSPGGLAFGNSIWLKADNSTNCDTSNCSINNWQDQFKNSFNAAQPNTSLQPSFKTATEAFNFNPSLIFNGSQRLAIENLFLDSQQTRQMYTWVVFKTDVNTGEDDSNLALFDFDYRRHFSLFTQPDSGTLGFDYNSNSTRANNGTTKINDDITHVASAFFDGTQEIDTTLSIDGKIELSADIVSTNRFIGSNTTRFGFIGDSSQANSFNGNSRDIGFKGEIAEIIYFRNQKLSQLDIRKVESYLALKYGINLDSSDTNYINSEGQTMWDTLEQYQNDILGIYRDDASDVHQRQSNSVNDTGFSVYLGKDFNGNFPIQNTSNSNQLNNLQSLVIGHNNSNFSFQNQSSSFGVDFCEGVGARIYRAVEVGEISEVTLVFDSEVFTEIDENKDYYFISSSTENFNFNGDLVKLERNEQGELFLETDLSNDGQTFFTLIESSTILPQCASMIKN